MDRLPRIKRRNTGLKVITSAFGAFLVAAGSVLRICMKQPTGQFLTISALSLFLVFGCSSGSKNTRVSGGNNNAKSLKGNNPFYEVYGERYYVLSSSNGYEQEGVASWYGKKFHGKQTSNQEIYDMYAMTAAHKTLPLPSTVRVTNLRNGKSVVVRVNDRGPFVDNRLIDMSYAAAQQLDMVQSGTTLVRVESINNSRQPAPAPAGIDAFGTIYMQVGAFGERGNAERLQQRISGEGVNDVFVHSDNDGLYRVRIGPIADVAAYDAMIRRMQSLQIADTHLVVENQR